MQKTFLVGLSRPCLLILQDAKIYICKKAFASNNIIFERLNAETRLCCFSAFPYMCVQLPAFYGFPGFGNQPNFPLVRPLEMLSWVQDWFFSALQRTHAEYRHTRILSTPTKHTKHKHQTQQVRKCIEETQKHPQLWGRLPNQKLQVIWAAAACVWVDTCIVVCCVQCLVDELMPDGIVCDCR